MKPGIARWQRLYLHQPASPAEEVAGQGLFLLLLLPRDHPSHPAQLQLPGQQWEGSRLLQLLRLQLLHSPGGGGAGPWQEGQCWFPPQKSPPRRPRGRGQSETEVWFPPTIPPPRQSWSLSECPPHGWRPHPSQAQHRNHTTLWPEIVGD